MGRDIYGLLFYARHTRAIEATAYFGYYRWLNRFKNRLKLMARPSEDSNWVNPGTSQHHQDNFARDGPLPLQGQNGAFCDARDALKRRYKETAPD
jgi:hypothetical protein